MELVSLYYFTELAKTMNFTKTAERLYITQQTLSNHIARLEEHFEMPLFYRSPSLSLTPAGELVLAFATDVNREHTSLKDQLADMKAQESGVLRFGASAVRINSFLPHILPQFAARYPKVAVQFSGSNAREAMKMVLDGRQDLCLTVSYEKNPNILARHMISDQIYLCVSDALLRQYYGEDTDALKQKSEHGANIADFAKLPFCISDNIVGDKVNHCFREAQVTPRAYFSTDSTRLGAAVCNEGLAASFITHIYLLGQQEEGRIPENLNIFPLLYRGEPLVQPLYLIRRKDRYLPQYSKYFLDLLYKYYSDVQHVRFDRIV